MISELYILIFLNENFADSGIKIRMGIILSRLLVQHSGRASQKILATKRSAINRSFFSTIPIIK